LTGLLARCRAGEVLRWGLDFAARALLNGAPVLVVAGGPGARLAAEAVEKVLARERVRAMLSIGTCGGLDPTLLRGDIVVAAEIHCAESGRVFRAWRPQCAQAYRSGVLLSVNRVIGTAAEKAALRSRALAVEMEASAVAARAEERGLAVGAIRAVLDTAQESFSIDFNALRSNDGRFRHWAVVGAALAHPGSVVPELWRLRQNLRIATARLGEFLAACCF